MYTDLVDVSEVKTEEKKHDASDLDPDNINPETPMNMRGRGSSSSVVEISLEVPDLYVPKWNTEPKYVRDTLQQSQRNADNLTYDALRHGVLRIPSRKYSPYVKATFMPNGQAYGTKPIYGGGTDVQLSQFDGNEWSLSVNKFEDWSKVYLHLELWDDTVFDRSDFLFGTNDLYFDSLMSEMMNDDYNNNPTYVYYSEIIILQTESSTNKGVKKRRRKGVVHVRAEIANQTQITLVIDKIVKLEPLPPMATFEIHNISSFYITLISVIAYMLVYALLMLLADKHYYPRSPDRLRTYGDSLWFVFISATTLGYGDYLATNSFSRLFNSLFIILNVLIFASLINNSINFVVDTGEDLLESRVNGILAGFNKNKSNAAKIAKIAPEPPEALMSEMQDKYAQKAFQNYSDPADAPELSPPERREAAGPNNNAPNAANRSNASFSSTGSLSGSDGDISKQATLRLKRIPSFAKASKKLQNRRYLRLDAEQHANMLDAATGPGPNILTSQASNRILPAPHVLGALDGMDPVEAMDAGAHGHKEQLQLLRLDTIEREEMRNFHKRILIDGLLMLCVGLFGILVFSFGGLLEGPNLGGADERWVDGLHYVAVTMSTVGYGDIYPLETFSARACGVMLILFGTVATGRGLGVYCDFVQWKMSIASKRHKLHMIFSDPKVFEEFDKDRNGRITKYEFLRAMLVRLGEAEIGHIRRIERQFEVVDQDGDGKISREELHDYVKERNNRVKYGNRAYQEIKLERKKIELEWQMIRRKENRIKKEREMLEKEKEMIEKEKEALMKLKEVEVNEILEQEDNAEEVV